MYFTKVSLGKYIPNPHLDADRTTPQYAISTISDYIKRYINKETLIEVLCGYVESKGFDVDEVFDSLMELPEWYDLSDYYPDAPSSWC